MHRSRVRSIAWLALAGGIVAACSISQRQVEEGEAGAGGSGHALGGSGPALAGHSNKAGTGNTGVFKAGAGVAATLGSSGRVSGGAGRAVPGGGAASGSAGSGAFGGVLELGGAAPECYSLAESAGAAGEAASAGADHGDCFEYLDNGLRCEGAEAHAQGPNLERVCDASSLIDCQSACLTRPDCMGVSDYLSGEALVNDCYLRHTPCGTPGTGDWHEEDAGKEYVKVCTTAGGCHFEYLGDWIRCEDDTADVVDRSHTSLQACVSACLADPTCTSVTDYFYLNQVRGCYLYTGTCDAPESLPAGDRGKAYVRRPCGTQ